MKNANHKISFQTTDGFIFLKHQDISYIKSEDIYAYVHNGNKEYFINNSLKTLESELPSDIFFRCHRSYIVNLNKVFKLVKATNCMLILENGAQVPVARNKKSVILSNLLTNNNNLNI